MPKEEISDIRDALVSRQRAFLVTGELVEERLENEAREVDFTDDEINNRYDQGEIRIVTEQARYPLESISSLLEAGNYKLNPEYQRRHRWSRDQKSRLIESFIMNVPVPPIFIYEYDYNRYEVMDGLQRLTAVKEFYTNSFALAGLEYWKELEGKRYDQLPSRIKDGINRRYLSSIVLLKETAHGDSDPDRLKRFVFGRINTGGVQLAPQELRNALHDGPMNRVCKDLARNASLRRLWGIPVDVEDIIESDNHSDSPNEEVGLPFEHNSPPPDIPKSWRQMEDVELVLRFFANRQRMIIYRDNIRNYLDDYLDAANEYDTETLSALSRIFVGTITLAEDIFGEIAFRRPRGNGWASVPSVSIFDALMNSLSRLLERSNELSNKKEQIREGLQSFYEVHATVFNLRGQTRSDLVRREVEFESYLLSFLD